MAEENSASPGTFFQVRHAPPLVYCTFVSLPLPMRRHFFAAIGGTRQVRRFVRLATLRPRCAVTCTSRPVSAVISTRILPPIRPHVVPG